MLTTEFVPKTERELAQWMRKNCYNFESYSIGGNSIWEGYGIKRKAGSFNWYYTERGEERTLQTCATEEAIIDFAFRQIKADKWARTHCIGFGFDKAAADRLAAEISALNIAFFQDEIPYYGPHKPAFRTFVLGCDCQKTAHLKSIYYQPP